MFHGFNRDLRDRINKLFKRVDDIEAAMKTGTDFEAVPALKEQEGSKDRNTGGTGQSRE